MHPRKTDIGIITYRRMLRTAIGALLQKNEASLPMNADADLSRIQGPVSIDAIAAAGQDWRDVWQASDQTRREKCPWDAAL